MNEPGLQIWRHLLRAGEFQPASLIRDSLPEARFTNLSATVADLVKTGAIAKRVDGKLLRYGVTSSCRVPRGMKVGEVAELLLDHQRAG